MTELADADLPKRHRAALSIVGNLLPEERLGLLALVVWGGQDANGNEHPANGAKRPPVTDAVGLHATGEGPRSSPSTRRLEHVALTYDDRQRLRQEIDRKTRQLLGVAYRSRHCPSCNIWCQAGFTDGCPECEHRAKARDRRERQRSRARASS